MTSNELQETLLDLRHIEPKYRHTTVFEQLDQLDAGEAFSIINDHDPKPLYYELVAQRGNIFSWKYEQKGPETWQVIITKNELTDAPTIGQLVAEDISRAEVFRKYGLDYCCGGKKSVEEACKEKGVDVSAVEKDLAELKTKGVVNPTFNFNRWEVDFLADYIYNEHHTYWYNEEPSITELVEKVAGHHGKQYPLLLEVKRLYSILHDELNTHFMKEERVLFPYIKQLAKATREKTSLAGSPFGSIESPIQMMEADHDAASDILKEISNITNGYLLPENACNSFALMYHKLQNLEQDLHKHIHLENNILFPKAVKMESTLLS